MPTNTDIVNRALQAMGTRTTVSDAELAGNTSNEAIQANLSLINSRDDLLRMAPWDCGTKTKNLVYITSAPGTPENTSAQTQMWAPGQPAPPWAYEYQYPVDCLRAVCIIPTGQTGYGTGVPITTAITGAATSFWQGPAVRFKVQTDQFYPITAAVIVSGGTGHAVNDIITLASGVGGSPPIGAPLQLVVNTVTAGVITSASIVNIMIGAPVATYGGSYFLPQTNPVAQAAIGGSTGVGVGSTFNLTFGPIASQRVILTNQEFATLIYIQQITDPNVMDTLFQAAWVKILSAKMVMSLTGDKKLANMLIGEANEEIKVARSIDGNEGFTVNDVTPDWIKIRGISYSDPFMGGPYSGYDWGGLWPSYV